MRNQVGVVLLLIALPTLAGVPDSVPEAPGATAAVDAPAVLNAPPSMVVSRDPVTGRLRPATGDEIAALSQDLEKKLITSTEDLEVIPSPVVGGGVMVRLDNRFQNVYRLQVTPEGHFESGCNQGDREGVAP